MKKVRFEPPRRETSFVEHGATIEGGTRGWAKHLLRLVVGPVRRVEVAVHRAAVGEEEDARRVDAARIFLEDHARLEHAEPIVTRARGRAQGLDPAGIDLCIVVQRGNPRPRGHLDASVAPFGKSQIFARFDEDDRREVGANHLDRAVGRPIVDDQGFEVSIRLRRERAEADREVFARIPVDDDDGDADGSRGVSGSSKRLAFRQIGVDAAIDLGIGEPRAAGERQPAKRDRLGDRE